MSPKGYITSQDLDEIKKEIEKDPNVKIEWTFEKGKKSSLDDLDQGLFWDTKIEDREKGLLYFIYFVTNKSKNKIFADFYIGLEFKGQFGGPSALSIDWIEIKRLKHPEHYAVKSPEKLSKIIFPIRLERVRDEYFKAKNYLSYIFPKSTHYYFVRIKPTHYRPTPSINITFESHGTFI